VAVAVGGTTGEVIAVAAGAIVGTGVMVVAGNGVGVAATAGVSVREQALKMETPPATSRQTRRERKGKMDITENLRARLREHYTTLTNV